MLMQSATIHGVTTVGPAHIDMIFGTNCSLEIDRLSECGSGSQIADRKYCLCDIRELGAGFDLCACQRRYSEECRQA